MSEQKSIHTIHSEEIRDHNAHIIKPPNFSWPSISGYFGSRIPKLFVPKEELDNYTWSDIYNPFSCLKELTWRQWNFFFLGFWAWTWDAFDFFTVSLNVTNIAKSLDCSVKEISWGITLVLMLRTVGAVIFGLIGDTRGRKWPYIINLGLLSVIQIGTGFVQTYKQFLAVRALFGIAMGGLFGICAAEALSDTPRKTRGILSGIFQEGYAFGYLLAVVFQRAIADTTSWRNVFFFSAGVGAIFMTWRFFCPETDSFLRQKKRFEESAASRKSKVAEFKSQGRKALKQYWLIIIYCVLMMAGFNFSSHGSQDLYPTMLTAQYGFDHNRSTVANVAANLGACLGGVVVAHLSTFIGRRLAILGATIIAGALIYPWAFIPNAGSAFGLQFGVQGAWGVVPIHLSELSPPQFRSFVTGVSYQLGNLCSSASSTIEATIGERFPIKGAGPGVYDYGKTMAIFMGCVCAYQIIIILLGPENRGADLGIERDDVLDEYSFHDDDEEFERKKSSEDSIDILKPELIHTEKGSRVADSV
ncbi:major facilitator superfamily domain-containing protein [Scheffersomyces xylosifermentans]|uniref:major facilitator superfamily domain-containing protein n=1 Tax=Scheffersomyces xylosifermentans TaxID=1304137 RepID=UPI00315DC9A7